MKTFTTPIKATLLATTLLAASIGAQADQLNVTFKHISKHEGNLMVAVFNSEENYQGQGKATAVAMIPVTGDSVSYTFNDLQSGKYAIKLFHDENNNGKMDTNMFGMPTEGYGFSNNVGKFGEPAFNEAAFEVSNDTNIEIVIR